MLSLTLLLSWILLPPVPPAANRLQGIVDEAMNQHSGAAVALDVETGELLAGYRMDVAARRLASPGSTVKPFTLMALQEAGLAGEATALMCPAKVRIGNHILDCSHPAFPHPLDPIMALAYSCNHFFTVLSEHLSPEALSREFSQAGLTSVSGKWPSEIPGNVQRPKSTQAVELMAVGEEGVQVTPLGLAEAYRGLIRPLRTPQSVAPELLLVANGMRAVVTTGTGRAAASSHIAVAGKTGTSAGHAWFAGFAPAEKPEVVIVVFLEKGTGGMDAAPIAGRIFDSYFTLPKGQR